MPAAVIGALVSRRVACVEVFGDRKAPLYLEEELALGRSVEKRRTEFTTGRSCARDALVKLGLASAPLLSGSRGEPLWPEGVVGSITHCDGFRAAAVARLEDVMTLGIDAEPNLPLPDDVLAAVATPSERTMLSGLGERIHWDRLLFSAKEAVYKAWFPLMGCWLGFEDVLISLDAVNGGFKAQLKVPLRPRSGAAIETLRGRWGLVDGVIGTAVELANVQR